jgi:hypothetical protein
MLAAGAKALSWRYPNDGRNLKQHTSSGTRSGTGMTLSSAVQLVQVEPDIWVANMVGQHGLIHTGGQPPIRYEAALGKVAQEANSLNASVHMPRIGCGLAGGTWEQIEPILHRQLVEQDIKVAVYDLGRGGRG